MYIRFKFRSAVNFDVVDIGDRPSISVMELRSKIITHKKLNSCHDFDLVFSDPLTAQEYKDETYEIPSNSSVIIKRVPARSVPSALSGCLKRQESDLVEAIPKGSDQNGTKGKFSPERLEPKVQEHVKLEKRAVDLYDLAEQNASLPSELRCSICNKFLREAVMIPCCQHSFCERCIHGFLSEKAKCPQCSSHKFTAEDLLPNLSLRQAIEHLLESQNQISISENALRRFAPDEESGIQAKDLSSAVTIVQKGSKKLVYPSVTEKESNHLAGASFHGESLIKKNASLEGSISGEGDGYAHHACSQSGTGNQPGLADFQGENDPVHLPQSHVQERGEDRKVLATARYRKADHKCYMCDAPGHFVRDCPFAYSPHPMLQTGKSIYAVGGMATHAIPYWNNTAFGPMTPFTSMYANPGMMPFNASMYPVSPIGVYPYMSSMYGHIPASGGNPRVGSVATLVGNRSEKTSTHAKFLETRNCEIRGNHSNEYMMRRQPGDDEDEDIQTNRRNLSKRSQEYLSHAERENSGSYSGEKHTQRPRGTDLHGEPFYRDVHFVHDRHGKNSRSLTGTRDRRAYHAERSNLEVEYISNSSDRYDGERHSHHHHNIIRKHHERKGHHGSDSSWSRRHGENYKRRVYSDENGGDHSRGSKHCRDGAKYIRNELFCRSNMVRRDEDYREDYHQPKRKRVY